MNFDNIDCHSDKDVKSGHSLNREHCKCCECWESNEHNMNGKHNVKFEHNVVFV